MKISKFRHINLSELYKKEYIDCILHRIKQNISRVSFIIETGQKQRFCEIIFLVYSVHKKRDIFGK